MTAKRLIVEIEIQENGGFNSKDLNSRFTVVKVQRGGKKGGNSPAPSHPFQGADI